MMSPPSRNWTPPRNRSAATSDTRLRRASRDLLHQQSALPRRQAELLFGTLADQRQADRRHTQLGMGVTTLLDQIWNHAFDHVDRNGKADPLVPTRLRQDRAIHADHLTRGVEQGSATVAGVDRRVCLQRAADELQLVGAFFSRAPPRAHDAGGDGLLQAQGRADGDRLLADTHAV